MGTILFTADRTVGLYDHEGYAAFLCECGDWSSTWGTNYLGSAGHRPMQVRAACECGWSGPSLPWGENYPTEDQHDAIMAVWTYEHAEPLLKGLDE